MVFFTLRDDLSFNETTEEEIIQRKEPQRQILPLVPANRTKNGVVVNRTIRTVITPNERPQHKDPRLGTN
jgi:hypothetical protein